MPRTAVDPSHITQPACDTFLLVVPMSHWASRPVAGVGLKSNPQGSASRAKPMVCGSAKAGELWTIMEIVRKNQDTFLEAWNEHIGG
ncbi:MAG: hypothetical protein JXJ30_07410 [Halothiobacillaceae bacterium]|nr:hypothetical protein [Halothiobacillaceae bacterium]